MSPATVQVGDSVDVFRNDNFIGYTTFRIRDKFDTSRVVAAFYRDGRTADGLVQFFVQFAYCSPKEKSSDKSRGQFIATYRLLNLGNRGGIPFALPEGFTGKMFRDAIKNIILAEANRKRIQWLTKAAKTPEDLI